MIGLYVVIITDILTEILCEFLHTEDVKMLKIIEIVLRVKPYLLIGIFKIGVTVSVIGNKLLNFL